MTAIRILCDGTVRYRISVGSTHVLLETMR